MDDRERLERVVLDFVPAWERQKEHNGYRLHGQACFEMLSGIPERLLSSAGRRRLQELVRKFGSPSGPPKQIKASFVESPVPYEASGKMTDDQWIRAIKKYNDESSTRWFQTPGKGGPAQLAGELEVCVKREPERFAKLALEFPSNTNAVFLSRLLRGLKDVEGFDEVKAELCRKTFVKYRVECGTELVQVLTSFQGPIPEDLLDILSWVIEFHPDPASESWDEESNGGGKYYGGDIYTCGINTARGTAAGALRELIRKEPMYLDTLRDTLIRLISDSSVAVRSCAATTLQVVYWHNEDLAMEFFQCLVDTDERLLGTNYVQQLIHCALRNHMQDVRATIKRMLESKDKDVRQGGGRLAGLAELYHPEEIELVLSAMAGDSTSRLGIAEIASENLGAEECREWCESKLLELFNDENVEVQECTASCFRSLEGKPLEDFEKIIEGFCQSKAFESNSSGLIKLLVESTYRLPGLIVMSCGRHLDCFEENSQKGDRDLAFGVSMNQVSQLIFRIYQQHKGGEWGTRALDLIDRMCLVGVQAVKGGLTEFER